MSIRLPKKLGREPLIDAIFELRLSNEDAVADVLPGFLFGRLDGGVKIERLPQHELPKPIRDRDPNLRFSALMRLHWDQYVINIGDRVVGIGCKLPYPGWDAGFRPTIDKILELIGQLNLITAVTRHSIKYVNIVEAETEDIADQLSKIRLSMSLGDEPIVRDKINLRIERTDGDIIHVVSLVTGATAKSTEGNLMRTGIVVDVDTIVNLPDTSYADWHSMLSENLNDLRLSNKETFFKCLTKQTIVDMEPEYDD